MPHAAERAVAWARDFDELLLAILTLIFLFDALRPFPDTPAILSLVVSEKFKLADARKQAAYRENFATRFRDVVLALRPSPVAIFVDDLDRCNKETVMQALEAMNFLSCNAPCFIILGMARARVEDLIGLANADLAKETIDALDISEEETGLSQEEREKRRRTQPARSTRMPVVGVLDSEGGVFDSEIWGDVEVMQQVFMRESYSTVIARVESPEALGAVRALLKDNPNLPLKAPTERDYFRDYLRYTIISHFHGEGAARQAVMSADLPLSKAVEMLAQVETLSDLFRLAQREREAARSASAGAPSRGR